MRRSSFRRARSLCHIDHKCVVISCRSTMFLLVRHHSVRKRALRKAAIYALAAFSWSVLIALGCAAWIPVWNLGSFWPENNSAIYPTYLGDLGKRAIRTTWEVRRPGVRLREMDILLESSTGRAHVGAVTRMVFGWPFGGLLVDQWGLRPNGSSEEVWTLLDALENAAGLRSGRRFPSMVPLSKEFPAVRRIPVWPTWGLATDVVFWAVLFAAIGELPRLLVASHRVRSGRCPRCGYPTDGVILDCCPECGMRTGR
jgi:hypothetical protein